MLPDVNVPDPMNVSGVPVGIVIGPSTPAPENVLFLQFLVEVYDDPEIPDTYGLPIVNNISGFCVLSKIALPVTIPEVFPNAVLIFEFAVSTYDPPPTV